MPADKSEKIDSSDMMDTHRLRGLEGGGGVEGLRYFCTATNWMFCGYLWTISLGSYFFGKQHTTWNWKQTFRFLPKV